MQGKAAVQGRSIGGRSSRAAHPHGHSISGIRL